MYIRRAILEDRARLAELARKTFRETFGTDNEPSDIETYLSSSFSTVRIGSELECAANTFLLAIDDHADQSSGESFLGYAKLSSGAERESIVRGPAPIELQRLYVDRRAIGQGVGAALMQECLEVATRTGHQTLWLGVWERNRRAIAFYRRWGFEEVGSHEFLLGEDLQTDLLMVRAVDAPD